MNLSHLVFACVLIAGSAHFVAAQEGRKVALLVGVDKYQKPLLPPLGFAEADVKGVAAELKALKFEVTLLTGSEATKKRIEDTVVGLVKPLGPNDLMLVMLAGHGQQLFVTQQNGIKKEDAFFCPVDGVAASPEHLYSLSHLIDDQLIPNVGHNLVLIDACRNQPRDASRGIQGRVTTLPEDTAILFSCRAGQISYEDKKLGHGLFTYALLKALRGGAAREGKIVWSQVVSYVDWMMASEELRRYMPNDRPQVPITAGGVPYKVLGEGNWKSDPPPAGTPAPRQIEEYFFNSIGMKMVKIAAGSFTMGSPASETSRDLDEATHPIKITQPFHLGVYEVTQSEYERVMLANPSYFRQYGDGESLLNGQLTDQLPVEQVSWDDANRFCIALSELPAESAKNRSYRLPTEAEWEYACRGSTTTPFSFGSTLNGSEANVDGTYPFGSVKEGPFLQQTVDVAMYKPNNFGLYNMHGNVSEWCSDWYDKDYYGSSPNSDPQGPVSGDLRVLRGGSWFDNPIFAQQRPAIRSAKPSKAIQRISGRMRNSMTAAPGNIRSDRLLTQREDRR